MTSPASHGLRESSFAILASKLLHNTSKNQKQQRKQAHEKGPSPCPIIIQLPFPLTFLCCNSNLSPWKQYPKNIFHFIFLLTRNTNITSIIALKFKNPQRDKRGKHAIGARCLFEVPFCLLWFYLSSPAFYEPFSLTLVAPNFPIDP